MPTPKTPSQQPAHLPALPPDKRRVKGVFARAVGSFVPKLAAKAFEKYGFHSAEIMTQWPQVVGADLASFTAPERIKWPRGATTDEDGIASAGSAVLVLRVEPARALDVEYRSSEIIDRINRYFGYRAIASLRIVQAPLLSTLAAAAPLTQAEPPADVPNPAPAMPANVDGELKSALDALWGSVSARRRRDT